MPTHSTHAPTPHKNDPLLLAGRILIILVQALLAIAAIAVFIAIPAMLFGQEAIVEAVAEAAKAPDAQFPTAYIIAVLIIVLLMIAAMFIFFNRLRRLIDTVGAGDPFVPINSERLNMMAIMLLLVQFLQIPLALMLNEVESALADYDNVDISIDLGIDLEGLIMVVVLFILARVFRHGTDLRDDLEGTV